MNDFDAADAPLPELSGEYVARLSMRARVWPMVAAAAALSTFPLGLVVLRLTSVLGDLPPTLRLPFLGALFAGGAVINAAVGLLTGLLLRTRWAVRLNADGAWQVGPWGRPLCFRWNEIERVEFRTVGLLHYVRLISPAAWIPIWFYLPVEDQEGLRDYVVRQAGSDNPLARWLTENVRG